MVDFVLSPQSLIDHQSRTADRAATTLVNGTTIFTIANGSIMIDELIAYCKTANDATASTLQFSSTPTLGSATTFSAATATLASATVGTLIRLNPTGLATAPDIIAGASGGVSLGASVANRIIVNPGLVTIVIGTGSTTGTWEFHMRYFPLAKGITVV